MMNKLSLRLTAAAAALLAAQGSPLAAETLEDVAARFGALPDVLDSALSPGGDKFAYISSSGPSAETVYVAPVTASDVAPKPILVHADPNSQVTWCLWATEDRLVCELRVVSDKAGTLLGFSRIFAMDADGGNVKVLTAQDKPDALGWQQNGGSIVAIDLADKPGKILMTREWVPERSTGTRLANIEEGLGVEEVDIRTLDRQRFEKPDKTALDYVADGTGRLRLKVAQPIDPEGYLRTNRQYYYRDANSNDWHEIEQNADFRPVAVDGLKDLAYGFVDHDGHDALATLALDGTGALNVVLARNDADVDELIQLGRKGRVVGASYATDQRQIAYSDPELDRLARQFRKALPGQPLINIVDASADEGKLALVASSDVDPGTVYLFDKKTRQLGELLPVRFQLAGRTMGKMTPVTVTAADGTAIPSYLTLPPGSSGKGLPAIVLPHGGPSARDEWGFDWLAQFFAARGYAVLQPNYRGSAGYGDAWFGANGFKAWKTAVGDVDDAGRWLVSQGIADPSKLAIVGWSYGGYAALQSQVLDNTLFKAVVAIAPVTDLEALREEHRGYVNFNVVNQFVGDGPHIEEGSPARHADRFAAPVLLFHGTLDQNVGVGESRLMKSRLENAHKQVAYHEFEGQSHSLADAAVRTSMLIDIDRFLSASLGPK
jgi:dipeptidyl aminopeptidase/acylaminoacyl peptidase